MKQLKVQFIKNSTQFQPGEEEIESFFCDMHSCTGEGMERMEVPGPSVSFIGLMHS